MFNGTLGTRKTTPLELELKDYVKFVCLRPYSVPEINEKTFKKEVERLVSLRVLK